MTTNPDGSITLSLADVRSIDALIAAANRKVRDAGSYTSADATEFASQWAAARKRR